MTCKTLKMLAPALSFFMLGLSYRGAELERAGEAARFEARVPGRKAVSLYRYAGPGADAGRPPVLLCHGIGSDHTAFEIGGKSSLSFHLTRNGYDVWALDFGTKGASIDTWADEVRVAADFVSGRTGNERVGLIGYDIGGTAILCGLIKSGPGRAAYVVGIGTTLDTEIPSAGLVAGAATLAKRGAGKKLTEPWEGWNNTFDRGESLWEMLIFSDGTVPSEGMESFLAALRPVPAGVAAQFEMMVSGELKSLDGSLSYSKNAGKINAPILMMAGLMDNFSQTEDIISVLKRVSSPVKTYRLLSRFNLISDDYGHAGLIMGRNAEADLFSFISKWARGLK